ncbi:hypothetical protein BDV98DRAFT_608443 [Pterulicium gracile]|uniref:Uncharacterized protein n=1 Tax=Pterulicium gracile TaxID=1884261 RepID=A0A5C3Q249_9AGAR|nr:hypothetical protein BDV98DRAFT_608443 [Pterula gracilis]
MKERFRSDVEPGGECIRYHKVAEGTDKLAKISVPPSFQPVAGVAEDNSDEESQTTGCLSSPRSKEILLDLSSKPLPAMPANASCLAPFPNHSGRREKTSSNDYQCTAGVVHASERPPSPAVASSDSQPPRNPTLPNHYTETHRSIKAITSTSRSAFAKSPFNTTPQPRKTNPLAKRAIMVPHLNLNLPKPRLIPMPLPTPPDTALSFVAVYYPNEGLSSYRTKEHLHFSNAPVLPRFPSDSPTSSASSESHRDDSQVLFASSLRTWAPTPPLTLQPPPRARRTSATALPNSRNARIFESSFRLIFREPGVLHADTGARCTFVDFLSTRVRTPKWDASRFPAEDFEQDWDCDTTCSNIVEDEGFFEGGDDADWRAPSDVRVILEPESDVSSNPMPSTSRFSVSTTSTSEYIHLDFELKLSESDSDGPEESESVSSPFSSWQGPPHSSSLRPEQVYSSLDQYCAADRHPAFNSQLNVSEEGSGTLDSLKVKSGVRGRGGGFAQLLRSVRGGYRKR